MPQYELMYLLGSQVADDQVPAISEQIKKFIGDFGGTDVRETLMGKKKLAYPIKKTRNGHYVVVNFVMDTSRVNELDAKIRTQDQSIIRYILVNLDEHLGRLEKDKKVQAKIVRREPSEISASPKTAVARKEKAEAKAPVLLDINQEELDKKIEEALAEDITK